MPNCQILVKYEAIVGNTNTMKNSIELYKYRLSCYVKIDSISSFRYNAILITIGKPYHFLLDLADLDVLNVLVVGVGVLDLIAIVFELRDSVKSTPHDR